MKKPRISVLLVLTIIFAAFTLGFFLGRNQSQTTITVSGSFLTTPTLQTETVTAQSEESLPISFPIAINEADKEELMALPGIGEVLAERIMNYRDQNGRFSSPEELLNVDGLGKKRLEEMIALITIGG